MSSIPQIVTTRFSPSPTGELHIGGIRTALFCYLYAKHFNGIFIIRTEDTDLNRNIKKFYKSHIKELNKLGIQEDESFLKPKDDNTYIQSERTKIYNKYLDILKSKNLVFYCICKPKNKYSKSYPECKCEGIPENTKKYKAKKSLKLKIPRERTYLYNDIIRKEIVWKSNDLKPFVIFKSNKMYSYNFAVVVDDIEMKITDIIRGEDHISNTLKQLILYGYFDKTPPKLCHLGMIVDENNFKISKRKIDGIPLTVRYFFSEGYLKEAIVNYCALLGWKADKTKEIFSMSELIKLFDGTHLSASASIFDIKKLQSINHHYIQLLSNTIYYKFCRKHLVNTKGIEYKIIKVFFNNSRRNLYKFSDLNDIYKNCFAYGDIAEAKNELKENFKYELIYNEIITFFKSNSLEEIDDSINLINFIKNNLGLKGKQLYMPIRLLISYKMHGIELPVLLLLLGKERILNNIEKIWAELSRN